MYLLGGQYQPEETPTVVAKRLPNTYSLNLETWYPGSSEYPIGHSALTLIEALPSGKPFRQSIMSYPSSDNEYNLVTNNCSDFTCKILQAGLGVDPNIHLFTTPGDVKDYVQLQGGRTKFYPNKLYATTTLDISLDLYDRMMDLENKLYELPDNVVYNRRMGRYADRKLIDINFIINLIPKAIRDAINLKEMKQRMERAKEYRGAYYYGNE